VLLKYQVQNPKRLMMLGMLFIIAFNIWPRYVPIGRGLDVDLTDGIRGLFMGLGIGFNLWFVWLMGKQRQAR
jgi:hypothetical protein